MLQSTRRRFVGERRSMEGTSVNAETAHRWLAGAAASLKENRNFLTQLDAAIGDADHGTNMDRGFTAVVEKLGATEGSTPGKLLTTAGSTLVSTVGGASGPLWGTALRRALREELERGGSLGTAVVAARSAAEDGMRATVPLQAAKGRASYLGERSIGHQDPGATSTALVFVALERAV